MKSVLGILTLGVLLQGLHAHAIGKVGTASIGDANEGFVADVPRGFANLNSVTNSGVRMSGAPIFKGLPGFVNPAFERIDAFPLRIDFPEFANLSRDEARRWFENSTANWTSKEASDPCVEVFTATNEQVRTTILTWGEGRGYVIISDVGTNTDCAVDSLVATTRLDSGACRW